MPLFTLLLSISYIVTCVVGLVGNLLVIVVQVFYEKNKKLPEAFLLNLALADLLFLCTLPFLVWALHCEWTFGEGMCKIVMGMYRVNLYTSMLTLTAITFDRFDSIVNVVKRQKYHQLTHRLGGWMCAVIWLIAILAATPQYVHFTIDDGSCMEDYAKPRMRITIFSIQLSLGFFLPLTAMVVCYTFILNTLIRIKRLQKKKSIRIILAVVVVYVVTQLPYNVALMVFVTTTDPSIVLVDVLQILEAVAYLHACLNPVLYFLLATKFKNNFRKMLRDLRLVKGREEPSQESEGSSKAISASTHMEAFSMVQAE